MQFLTVPRRSYTYDPNRDELVQPDAGRLFDRLRDDVPVEVAPRGKDSDGAKSDSGDGSEEDSEGDSSSDSAFESGSDSGESGGYEEDSSEGGYWDDEGSWVDEKPGGRDSGVDRVSHRATGDDKPDEPTKTPSPAPTFRGNTAARTSCE